MAVIVGGHETGLLDTSNAILDRNDRTRLGATGHGENLYVNASNGNLMIRHEDAFMPSLGEDYQLARTYNARGRSSDAHQHEDARWTFSTTTRLTVRNDGGAQYFEVEYGDGSFFQYEYDESKGVYVSTDGAGPYETIEDLGANGNTEPSYILTRGDQTELSFDSQGRLLKLEDTNGVQVEYVYESDRLVQVLDDQGHVLNYIYQNGKLFQVTDESEGVLAEYRYESGNLSEVIDRFGHSTKYFYTNDGFLERIVLPNEQMVDGQLETYDNRELNFVYDTVNWRGDNKAKAKVVSQIIDAAGGVTTFDYDFQFSQGADNTSTNPGAEKGGKKGHFKNGKVDSGDVTDTSTTNVDKFFEGGSTTVVDALGNNRAYSNDQEYVDWRVANGFYGNYDASRAATSVSYQGQVDAIRNAHSMSYTYRDDGYITKVVDQKGFETTYQYDEFDNLVAVTDRNAWGTTNSDDTYFRKLRAELGIVNATGEGKFVNELTGTEIQALVDAFTSRFEYDDNGNLTASIDNVGNTTTYTYTSFNKMASRTSAVGNALVTLDTPFYQEKRAELGFAASLADLSEADKAAILDLHTTYFEYDGNQNLIERRDAGNDITRFEYDEFGNLTKRIVFLDSSDLVDPAKQQVTTYAYDGFGNNISSTDAEGYQTFSEYDHFGNLTRFTDANGGVTTYTYDKDNRLLTVTDPEGHTTINTYDAVGNRISITDANGHTITRLYDRNNNLIATIDPSETDALMDRVTSYEYDVVGNRTAVVDAEGRRTEYQFNARREMVEVISASVLDQTGNAVNYSTTYRYDGEGNRVSTTNNRGYTTEILYTRNNLVRQQTDPNGHITRINYDANNNEVQIVAGLQLSAAKRQILRFSYDEENQLVTRTDAEGNVTQYAYDAPGNRVATTDGNGNTTEYEFDGNNRLVREIRPEVIDPSTGMPVRYTVEHVYDGNGNEIKTIDENGHATRFTFDLDDKLVMVEDANGIKTVFEYDSRHNRTAAIIGADAQVDASGHIVVENVDNAQTTRYVYDEFNQVVAQVDGMGNALAESDAQRYQEMRAELGFASAAGQLSEQDKSALRELYTTHLSYDRVGNLLLSTDHLGRTTEKTYDALNRVVSDEDALGGVREYAYDGNNNLTRVVDELGRATTASFDSMDREIETVDPIGAVTSRDYDDFGNLIGETRASGTSDERTTTYEYDLNNRLISQLDPEQHQRHIEYDAVGNRIRVTDARGNATQYLYNALNRNVKIIDPLSFETAMEYDGVGNRIALIDARGGVSRFDYDPGNRQIVTTDAEGRVTTYAYDVRGNRIEMRTASGTSEEQVTVMEYDAENNLRRVIDAEGGITENDFDRVYNRTAITDANGNTTMSEFDALDRLVRVTDAEGQVTSYQYDAVDNRVSRTDALGRVTEYVHDDNDRLIREIAADGVETEYQFDLVGNRTSITRAANTADASTQTFVYDLDDRLIEQVDGEGNVTRYAYDGNDNRTTVTDANGNVSHYTYDANNQVVLIEDPEGNQVRYAYDGNGNRVQVIDGRGYERITGYNANNEVILEVDAEGYATTYAYDHNGNVAEKTLHMQASSLPVDPENPSVPPSSANDQTTRYEYDKLNRVVGQVDAEGYRQEYVYDAVGNQLETHQYRDLAGTDIAVTRSYYDDVNRAVARVSAEGYLTQYEYDSVGNQVSRTVYDNRVDVTADGIPVPVSGDTGRRELFVYDSVNRLIEETSPLGVETHYEFDARGNRTALVEAAGTDYQRTTHFGYDLADRLVETISGQGTITRQVLDANGNVVERIEAYGSADERTTRMAYDGNNQLVSRTDAHGVVTTMAYDASGNLVRTVEADGLTEARETQRFYDGNGQLLALVNAEGERTEYQYDGAGNRVLSVEAPGLPEQRQTAYEYDRDNRRTAIIDGEGVRTEFRYDGADNQVEMIQAVGVPGEERHTYQSFDLDNRLIQTIDPMGESRSFTYDVLGNRVQVVDENGGVEQNTFDAIGRLTSTLTAGGTLITNEYDLRDNLVSRTTSFADGTDARSVTFDYDILDRQVGMTDANGFSTATEFDVFGNATSQTSGLYLVDPASPDYDAAKAASAHVRTTHAAYDDLDRLVSETDALGTVTTYGFDAVGNRTSMTDAAGTSEARTTQFVFDLVGRVVEQQDPEGGITRNSYDELGQVVKTSVLQSEDAAGNQIWIDNTYEYDRNGRLIADVDGEGVRNEYQYDAVGNRITTRLAVDGDEAVTRTEYDLNNRVAAVIDGEGNRTEYGYDAVGNRILSIDPRGAETRFYYDSDNRLVSKLNSDGYITEYSYDSVGNQLERREYFGQYDGGVQDLVQPNAPTSAMDRVTSFVYDAENQLVQQTNADGTVTRYQYDAVGNQTAVVDEKGRETSFAYDLNNQLVVRQGADGIETHYAYDMVGNQVSVIRAAGTDDESVELRRYDLNNRLVQRVDGLGNLETSVVFDKAGNRVVQVDANGYSTEFDYDLNNRVISETDGEGNVTRYTYDDRGNLATVTDGRGFTELRFYTDNDQLSVSVDREGFATSYQYDGNDNLVAETLHMQRQPAPFDASQLSSLVTSVDDQVVGYEYDSLNRMTARVDGEGYRTEFRHDAAGNVIETIEFRNQSGTETSVSRSYFDAMDREVAYVSPEGYLSTTRYDDAGNRVEQITYEQRVSVPADGVPTPVDGDVGRTERFEYDAVDRLVERTSALGVETSYEYDARGNRVALVEAAGTEDQRRTEFSYDLADREIQVRDANGTVTVLMRDANGNIAERHEAYGTGEARMTSFVHDGNNRVVSTTDTVGTITETEYDAAGNTVRIVSAVGTPDERIQTFEYDQKGQTVVEVNGEGDRTESVYDGAGNRIRLTVAPGSDVEQVNQFEYDRDNRLVAGVDGEGVRTEYRYDGIGNKIETIQAAGVPGEERHTYYTYDLDDRLLQVVDPMGGTTQYTYDVLGNQTEIVDANGGVQTNTFDAVGQLLNSVSAGGVETTNQYDLRGNIVETTQGYLDGTDQRTTRYGYDLLDRQILVTDPEGFSTTMEYDPFGNQTRITHGQYLLSPTDASYDADKAARAFPQSNTFTYDAADRMLTMEDGVGNQVTYTYDALGNRTSMTEAADTAPRTTEYRYDRANRLVETITPEGGITRLSYDEAGNQSVESVLQQIKEGVAIWSSRTFEYDGNGRVAAEVDPYGIRSEHEYDALGNKVLTRAAAGTVDERITRAEFDLNNRVSAEIDGEGNRTAYEYDALGNRTKATDALGRSARYYFDGSNNLVAVLDPEGYVNSFRYDSAGNRTGETVSMERYTGPVDDQMAPTPAVSPEDRVSQSTYDGNSRVTERVEADGSTTTYEYDGAGNLLREVQYANTEEPRELNYTYDLNNRLVSFLDVDGTVTEFTYDGANNKTSETITNTDDPNAVRRTEYEYDLNNRMVNEVFDPEGLNIAQTIVYDLAGNAIEKTDGNGSTTRTEYDLNNRVTRQIDALGNDTLFSYDAVGNRTAITDTNGNTTNIVYDNNNRATQEIGPRVQVYSSETGTLEWSRPTVTRTYDAAGNEVQTIDAQGYVTTRYFDSNDRAVAEINSDNVLTQWSYNAAGEQVEESLFMTRLSADAHDPAVVPATPTGDVRTTEMEYDLAGRVVRIIHPEIEVASLNGENTDNPSVSVNLERPEERFTYDAFGNQIETFDRNGNRTVAYYDSKDRLIAQVDAEGYLTEFDYDAQDNVTEQRLYATALDAGAIATSDRPVPPAGTVLETSRVYDAASRLTEERSPMVDVFDAATLSETSERVVTRYGYDAVGNQISKTLAAGSPQEYTEYTYYDALNRQIAVVDGNRVVNLMAYDGNGNQTLAKRFFNPVDGAINLATLSGETNFATLVAGHENDQSIRKQYDSNNQLVKETDLMAAGTADDLVKTYGYDANGNQAIATDEDGFTQKFAYNGLGQLTKSVSPDQSGTVYEYDAAGNQISAFTGQVDGVPVPASSTTASLGQDLTIGWSLPDGARAASYVVYDTVSREGIEGYANQSATQGTWFSNQGSATIPADALSAGDTLYYRVVTRDAGGSLTWTAEESVTIPPRLSDVGVSQRADGALEVVAGFEAGAGNPEVKFGTPGATDSTVVMQNMGDGTFKAVIEGVTNPQELAYRIGWENAQGASFLSSETPFEAQGGHTGVTTNVDQTTVTGDAEETQYRIDLSTQVPADVADGLLTLAATWSSQDDPALTGSTSVEGSDSGSGYSNYNMTLGAGTSLPAGTYTVTLRGVGEEEDTVLNTFEVTVGDSFEPTEETGLSWTAPSVGDGQLVILDGKAVPATREGEQLVVATGLQPGGSADYTAFFGDVSDQPHTTTVTSTEVTEVDDTTDPETVTVLGHDLQVGTQLSAEELANVTGDLQLAWRPAGSGTEFANTQAMVLDGDTHTAALDLLPAGEYDLKVFYTDQDGNEVIVDWLRADTAAEETVTEGQSLTVLASEADGEVARNAAGTLSVDPGLYSGPAGGDNAALSLSTEATGNGGGSKSVDGRDTGYFVETQYNALNERIATNAETGLWREFDVDANGNVIATHNFGTDGVGEALTSYSAYDGRNRETARFDVAAPVAGRAETEHAVTRMEYDVQDNLVREVGPDGHATRKEWNALGSLLSETDELQATTIHKYDRLGRKVAEIDPLGNAQYSFYDTVGNLVQKIDGEGNSTRYTYDVFGRRETVTNGLNQSVSMDYDHRDRLVKVVDGMDGVTRYEYDGRDNRTATVDANGHRSEQSWDGLGRVEDTITYQNGERVVESSQYDFYGNMIASTDGMGRVTTQVYGEFGRVMQEVDAGGRITFFEYDDQGNVTREWSNASGKDIRRVYDDTGRLTEVNDLGTGVKTTYTYDINGQRVTENITTPDGAHNREIAYEYDAVGQMVRWADATTGAQTNYQWDSAGNLYRLYTDAGYDPDAKNVDLASVLQHAEEHIRSFMADPQFPGDQPKPRYEGSLNEILRERAVDLGVDTALYDKVFDLESTGWDFTNQPEQQFAWQVNVADRRGALQDLLSDLGYQSELDSAIIDPNYRLVDQVYQYDGNNRVAQINNGAELDTQYGYDVAGNRVMVNNGGQITEYTFDANGRVTESHSGGNKTADWQYDNVGNVERFRTFKSDGSVDKVTTKQYYENNVNYYTNDDGQQTTMTMDKSGRVTRTKLVDDGDTFYFDHKYNAAGLETRVNARGKDVGGRTLNTYDSNDNLIVADKGEGDSQDRREILKFVYNNDNQILYRFHDTGKNEDLTTDTEYLYANSKAVGETGTDVKGDTVTKLGTGNYNLVQPLGEDFPSSAVTFVTASEGDNLQSIAAAVYGNPSLWFVLAEANGLEPGQSLKEGQRIEVPNTVKTGSITAETHKVYDESEIVGSTLPNLKSDPKDSGCGSFLAIVITVIAAVVVTVLTAGAGAGLGAAMVSAAGATAGSALAASLTVLGYAVAGAVIGAAASMVQQGLFIALDYQDEFSWKQVAAGAVGGALSGAAQGFAALSTIKDAALTAKYAKVASRASQVASVASKQVIEHGKITSWASLASAGLGPVAGVEGANGALAVDSVAKGLGGAWQTALDHVTPWLGAAESYIRTGEVTPMEWASSISGTLSTAVGTTPPLAPGLEKLGVTQGDFAINLLVGGALSRFDGDAAEAYFANYAGNEVGSWIGGSINEATGITKAAKHLTEELRKQSAVSLAATSAGNGSGRALTLEENIAAGGIDLRRPQGTGGAELLMNSQPARVEPETYTLQEGDNPWNVAQNALGSDASETDVQEYVYRLISANPDLQGANTRALQPGMTLTLPSENQQVSDAALRTYAGDEAYGQVASIREQLLAGGSFDPNIIGRLQGQFERAGLPLDAQLDMQSSQRTVGYQSRSEDIAMGQLLSRTPVLENQLSVNFQLNGSGLSFSQMDYALGDTQTELFGAMPAPEPMSTEVPQQDVIMNEPAGSGLPDAQADMRSYWSGVQDRAVESGSPLAYMGAGLMSELGDIGYSLAGMASAVVTDPGEAGVGAAKSIGNFGPEAFNSAVGTTKMVLDGYTQLAELAGVEAGTFEGFRSTDPYTITPLMEYDNEAQAGGALLGSGLIGGGVSKFGRYGVEIEDIGSVTRGPMGGQAGAINLRFIGPNDASTRSVLRTDVQSQLDALPNGQGNDYYVRQRVDGQFSVVRNDLELQPLRVTDEGNLYSPVSVGRVDVATNARGNSSVLLPDEGRVATAGELQRAGSTGDNITPHHIPSANHMSQQGVNWNDGIAINMDQPHPGVGGRHRETFTYGTNADSNLSSRDALAAGVRDARRIYQADGLYDGNIRAQLQELIELNKRDHPQIFRRQDK